MNRHGCDQRGIFTHLLTHFVPRIKNKLLEMGHEVEMSGFNGIHGNFPEARQSGRFSKIREKSYVSVVCYSLC